MLIAATAEPLFERLRMLLGRPELVADPRFIGNRARVEHSQELDVLIGQWTQALTAADLQEKLNDAGIPSSKAYTAADAAEDPQYRYRGMVREVDDPALGPVLHSGVVPHVPESPGEVRWTGPAIGQHSDEILALAGYAAVEIAAFRDRGVIG